jgi:hypothetical protein
MMEYAALSVLLGAKTCGRNKAREMASSTTSDKGPAIG